MYKEKLEPSQWVIDYEAFITATGTALSEGGNTITTLAGITLAGSVLITCIVLRAELQGSLQVLLSGIVGGAIVSDPKKGLSQTFQRPVENAIASTNPQNTIVNTSSTQTEDDEEWFAPEDIKL